MFKISFIEGLKNMRKNRFLTVLTVFLFAFLFLLQGYTISYYTADAIMADTYGHENYETYYYYSVGSWHVPPLVARRMYLDDAARETAEFYEEIEAAEHITFVGIEQSSISVTDDFKGLPEIFSESSYHWDVGRYVLSVKVTPNFHKIENYRIIEGRDFTDEDMELVEGKPRAVLLGYKYRGIYEVGDVLDIATHEKSFIRQLEVIGFLAEDTTVLEGHTGEVVDLDNRIVYPGYVIPIEEWDNYDEDVIEGALNTDEFYCYNKALLFMFTDETLEQGLQELNTALDNYGQLSKDSKIYNMNHTQERLQSQFEEKAVFFAEITTVLMFFSVITVLISIVNRVSRNIKDYAIHIAVGATKSSAVAFILSEMSLILLCSMSIGIFATKWMMNFIFMPFYFFRFLGVFALTSVIILVLSAIITVVSISKYDVCTTIK